MNERSFFVKLFLTIPAIYLSFKRLFKFTFAPVSELWNPTPQPEPQPEVLVEKHDFH